MRYLITGGAGFLGTNLAEEVLHRGDELCVADNLYRFGGAQNLDWLRSKGTFLFRHTDIRNASSVEKLICDFKPDVIFHLAGQVAMTTSIEDPRLDFETNVVGTHNILEAVRRNSPETFVTYSSTNKVYGDLEQFRYEEKDLRYVAVEYPYGFDEKVSLSFESPYGCSKGAADQYMLDYARVFKLKTAVFRHSSIFGLRQFSTFDQGWIGWFTRQALDIKKGIAKKPFTISGNGKQVRDILFSSDLVSCYFAAVREQEKIAGRAYNIGGGPENSSSLLELFQFLEKELDVSMKYEKLPWRFNDQKVFIADIRKAKNDLGWEPQVSKFEGLKQMVHWVENHG
jgi:CDP-paratose 2-epimerase